MEIVKKALFYPVKQISENAGKEGSVIVNSILNSENVHY
jgi:chaperonin GroEL (HSP60 family)|tara:strand:- start:367 stop:483 length:117 start_codon:yes stop_codon:yes gene_type:complete